MPEKIIRTVGAAVVLIGIAVAALAQLDRGDPSAAARTLEGSPSSETPSTSPTSSLSATTEAPHSQEDTSPFVYRVGLLAGVSTDNFWAFHGRDASVWNAYVLGPTKPALYTVSADDSTLVPELAATEAEPVLESGVWQVTIDLNPELRWSDGIPITAHDYVFTFETVRALGLAGSWSESFPEQIKSVEAKTTHELRIEFSARPTLGVWPHGPGLAPIMPRHVWAPVVSDIDAEELYELPGSGDVGGGPLALEEVSDDLLVSRANAGYPFGTRPDMVEYRVFDDEEAALQALEDGTVDTVLTPKGLTARQAARLESHPQIATSVSPSNGVRYLGFNLDRAPMSEISFRTAVARLLDRQSLAETLTGAPVAYTFVDPANGLWYDPDAAEEIVSMYAGDPVDRLEAALTDLRGAGYSWTRDPAVGEDGEIQPGEGLLIDGGKPPSLTILTSGDAYDPTRPVYAEAVAAAIRLLGFDVSVIETDFDTVVDLTFERDEAGSLHFDMYLLGWTLGSPALPTYYGPLFSGDGPSNNSGYRSETFDERLAAYLESTDPARAREALWEMERVLASDIPYLPLYRSHIVEAHRVDRVKYGIQDNLGGIQGRLGGIGDVRPVS